MEENRVETMDIFRGAFFLCQGGRLSNVRVKEDTRQVVSFLFEMDGIDRLDMDYRSGQALVNPLEFLGALSISTARWNTRSRGFSGGTHN